MMKIAMLAAGNSVHTMRWVNALVERGLDVYLLSVDPFSPSISPRVTTIRLPIPAPTGYLLNRWWLNNLLRRIQPDVIHSHYATGYGTLGRVAQYYPKILSVWGSDIYRFPTKSSFHRRLLKSNLRNADCVCSTSNAMAEATRRLASDIRRLEVIPFGVDLKQFRPAAVHNSNSIVIGTIKTLRNTYGIDVLIRGFALCRQMLAAKNPHLASRLRLKIGGGGPDRECLERLVAECRVADVSEFLGVIDHSLVPAQLQGFDVFVAMSRSESFGVSVVEASACGLPVIVSNVGGLPEVVVHGQTGLIVQTEDHRALAVALLELVENAHLRSTLGGQGRKFVARKFAWHENVSRMIALYREIAPKSAAA
jgi:L-malate glycosyltransferase